MPCAGAGTRLGLKTPKELYGISPGKKLIDFSLMHIRQFEKKEAIKVAVVVRPWKMEVADYVVQRLPGIEVETVMFNDHYEEWPGSVYSAEGAFSQNNMVLLPDSFMEAEHLVKSMMEALKGYHLVFGFRKCDDETVLRTMGAMRVENENVMAFQDKPAESFELYNGFWGCYGFRKRAAKEVYDFLIASVKHQPLSFKDQAFQPVGTIPINNYYDLGTWERIEAMRCDAKTDYLSSSNNCSR